jgi:toxin ParE1/3/4
MGNYVVKPKADHDLDEYADYLAEASVDLALRFLDLAHRTFALLATQPNMGRRCRLRHPRLEGLRVFRVRGFEDLLILYRPQPQGVEVLRVVHGSRNLEAWVRREAID